MTPDLPGEHYCSKHQGNTSRYPEKHCRVCRYLAERRRIRKLCLAVLNKGGVVGKLNIAAQVLGYEDFRDWNKQGRPLDWYRP